ncbi:hypothetical protein H5410_020243 [Solanum commersonii]|uniref:Uncharacterized protein n=1 Tax=Solanum commersonii TaxID=4109 RepID=A0A9J5Z8I3_SOLCO|nr:hypothetical protein H5410_020243 [Solanum commersonii]
MDFSSSSIEIESTLPSWGFSFITANRFPEALNDVERKSGEDSINATSLGHGIGNIISMGDNSARKKTPLILQTTQSTMIPTPNAMSDFCVGKPRRGTRSVIPPKRLDNYFWKGIKSCEQGQN